MKEVVTNVKIMPCYETRQVDGNLGLETAAWLHSRHLKLWEMVLL